MRLQDNNKLQMQLTTRIQRKWIVSGEINLQFKFNFKFNVQSFQFDHNRMIMGYPRFGVGVIIHYCCIFPWKYLLLLLVEIMDRSGSN